jgi:hypothetical protein
MQKQKIFFGAARNSHSVLFNHCGRNHTARCGGDPGCGMVFKLAPNGDGTWSETILYAFSGGLDGAFPFEDRLLLGPSGDVLGTTSLGGSWGVGTVFAVKP